MADKHKKKFLPGGSGGISVPKCPVCLEPMTAPIRQCKAGHSMCNNCTNSLQNGRCPICREDMTGMRNFQLEELISELKVHCPNKPCVYTVKTGEMDQHLKECIFRIMDCPLGVANGKCSWNGMLKDMLAHFEERHPSSKIKLNENIELKNIKPNEDERLVFLANMGKYLFIVTFRIDTLHQLSYFVIQHIGSRPNAHNYLYDIQITSSADGRRQLSFKDRCFSDAVKVDEVFQLGQCLMIPSSLLQCFLKNKAFSFRLWINRPATSNSKGDGPQTSRSMSPKPDSKGSSKPRDRSQSKGPHKPTKYVTKSTNV